MGELHNIPYSTHLGYKKIIIIIRRLYCFPKMMKGIIKYIAICLECGQINVEHRHPTRLL